MNESERRDDAFRAFDKILVSQGVRPALAFLLAMTDYRCIGLWRFQGGKANAAVHFDRLHPEVVSAQEVPDNATYCCYVRDSRGVFMTAHALLDPRTEGHPAREAVPAYCGVPVMDTDGQILATLCHYDFEPRDPGQVDLELMVRVSSRLSQGDHVPPYPG